MGRKVTGFNNKSSKTQLRQSQGRMNLDGMELFSYRCSRCFGPVNGSEAVPDGFLAMAHPRCLRRHT